MDSISQLVLGATVCALAAGQPRRRLLVYGAALGTLPDLDVLVLGHLDPVEQLIRHRSFSHSLFVLTAVSPLIAWLLRRLDKGLAAVSSERWLWAVWLTLITHPLLDAFTVYGTQLWWPLMPPPTSWASMFIIDPLYTLPMLAAVIYAWRVQKVSDGRRALVLACVLSQSYLAWSLVAQSRVEGQVRTALLAQGQAVTDVLVTPAPFTTLLWRVLIRTPQGHSEAWISLLRGGKEPFRVSAIAEQASLHSQLPSLTALKGLGWFSHGYLRLEEVDGRLRVSDLRMGADPDYFFSFDIAERGEGGWRPIEPRRVDGQRPRRERLGEIFERL